MKRAVVFYSLSGNTKEAAEIIAKEIGADTVQIDLVKPLPPTQVKQILVGGMYVTFGLMPKIKGVPEDISMYDEIILGTPIWAGKAAAPIHTVINKYGIADRITAVFTFSGGGDNDKCLAALTKTLHKLKTQVALADRNSESAALNKEKLKMFIQELNPGVGV